MNGIVRAWAASFLFATAAFSGGVNESVSWRKNREKDFGSVPAPIAFHQQLNHSNSFSCQDGDYRNEYEGNVSRFAALSEKAQEDYRVIYGAQAEAELKHLLGKRPDLVALDEVATSFRFTAASLKAFQHIIGIWKELGEYFIASIYSDAVISDLTLKNTPTSFLYQAAWLHRHAGRQARYEILWAELKLRLRERPLELPNRVLTESEALSSFQTEKSNGPLSFLQMAISKSDYTRELFRRIYRLLPSAHSDFDELLGKVPLYRCLLPAARPSLEATELQLAMDAAVIHAVIFLQTNSETEIEDLLKKIERRLATLDQNTEYVFISLGRIGKRAVPILMKSLQSPYAQDALVNIGSDAVDLLVEQLGGGIYHRDQGARTTLIRIGKPAIPALVSLLSDPKRGQEASDVLVLIGEDSVPSLLNAISSEDYQAKTLALASIGRIAPKDPAPSLTPIQRAIADKNPAVRQQAIQTLGAVARNQDAAALILSASLKDENEEVVKETLLTLATFNKSPKAVVQKVSTFLETPLAPYAIRTLSRIDPNEHISIYIRKLKDENASTRSAAASALNSVNHYTPEMKQALISAAHAETEGEVLEGIARALGNCVYPPKETVPVLIEILGKGNYSSQVAACRALGEFGPEARAATEALAEIASENSDSPAWVSLGRIGKQAVPFLASQLHHPLARHRMNALAQLRFIESDAFAALPALEKKLLAPEGAWDEYQQTVMVLESIGPAALPVLRTGAKKGSYVAKSHIFSHMYYKAGAPKEYLNILREGTQDESDDVRLTAYYALSSWGKEALPDLIKGLNSKSPQIVEHLCKPLKELAGPEAIPALREAAANTSNEGLLLVIRNTIEAIQQRTFKRPSVRAS